MRAHSPRRSIACSTVRKKRPRSPSGHGRSSFRATASTPCSIAWKGCSGARSRSVPHEVARTVIATAPHDGPAGARRASRSRASRWPGRAHVVARALLLRRKNRAAPADPRRILGAHPLLLGDTLMLTPLLKKLRTQHPRADIAMTVPARIAPLYATQPYGVRALPFDPRHSHAALFAEAPFDLALVPGDNRYAWLAAAMRARFIVAFAGDRPAAKSWQVDRLLPYPDAPAAWGDLVAQLIEIGRAHV